MHERDIVIITRISYVTRLRWRSTLQTTQIVNTNFVFVDRWLALIEVLLKTFGLIMGNLVSIFEWPRAIIQ